MMRVALALLFGLASLIAVVLSLLGGPLWAAAIVCAALTIAIVFERSGYGRPAPPPIDRDWAPTDEIFVDDQTSALVRVWFNDKSGERRYVQEDQKPASKR